MTPRSTNRHSWGDKGRCMSDSISYNGEWTDLSKALRFELPRTETRENLKIKEFLATNLDRVLRRSSPCQLCVASLYLSMRFGREQSRVDKLLPSSGDLER